MFLCHPRSILARVKATQRIPKYPILSRICFSTIIPLQQATPIEDSSKDPGTRLPLALQAVWYEPFRRTPTHGLPVCDLQLRSFSVRNLEFMCDFALRAAYYCHLPAAGPVPLPKRTERWTVPRGHFVHKKSQENYERVTHKRLIQIKDGHPETVELWLAFLRKHQYYGVGMKANMFGFDELGVGKRMNISLETIKDVARPKWSHFGSRKSFETAEKARELLESEEYKSLSHEEVLKEITEVEHFQNLAKGILENPKFQAFADEKKDLVKGNVEEKEVIGKVMTEEENIQAKVVEEALEKIEGIEMAQAEVVVEVVQEAPGAEEIQATPTEAPMASTEASPIGATPSPTPAPAEPSCEAKFETRETPTVEPVELETKKATPTTPKPAPEVEAVGTGSPIIAPADILVATPIDASPIADIKTTGEVVVDKGKEEGVLPEVTESREEKREEVKVEGEKPKD